MLNLLDVVWILCIVPVWVTYLLLTHYPDKVPDVVVSAFLYGKLSKNKRASVLARISIPKRCFTQFYEYAVVLFTIWTLVLCCISIGLGAVPRKLKITMDVLIHNRTMKVPFAIILWTQLLLTVQVARRCYECMFVSVFSNVRMHIWHFAMGFIFYTGVQYSLLSLALPVAPELPAFSLSDLWSSHVILGSVMWLVAVWLEYDTAKRFAAFRKNADGKRVSSKHVAPYGGMFELISSPHYLAEIMVYTSITVVLGCTNLTWLLSLLWTYVNQIAIALLNHRWYQDRFKNYPSSRKAIIPFLL
ncbi:polyprenol reductase-like isoform X2 [Varroa jacobsoni]|uniref:Polyprenal reductase n=1 Tax=Varroa destructor TaxID=109461 RepID=A0A7M7J0H4_VARDE|nr:polyprenol reductase-like isoform X2 [Varroa destructor]XP_022708919.1 polyprenol reductase-like isoform X2 [Varroa jacobsoni]XP_022708920.1 polyprenol reductase-like isoform X2 [Varroa jacobsoni]